MSNVLVFAEHQHKAFSKATLVAIGAGVKLAAQSGGDCHAAVLGNGVGDLANELTKYGVKKVFVVEHAALENYTADAHAQALSALAEEKGCDVVVGAASTIGKDLLPRVAVRLGAGMASDITDINDDGTMIRPTYAGNAMATISIETPRKVISVRTTAFEPAAEGGQAEVEKVAAAIDESALKIKFVGFNETKSDRPNLAEARVVVSGGRGLKNGENFKTVLEPLVDALGAAMGASRAAVDAGFVPNDLQVGQTGKVVAPELGDDLHHVEGRQLVLFLALGLDAVVDHGHAERAGDGDRVGLVSRACSTRIMLTRLSGVLLHPHAAAAGAAAHAEPAAALHLLEVTPGRRRRMLARRLVDVVVAAEVAGVVVGDRCAPGRRSLSRHRPSAIRSRRARWRAPPRSRRRTADTRCERVEAVRAVGEDLLDVVAVEDLVGHLRHRLEEVLVADAARGLAVAGLFAAEDGEVDAGLLENLARAWVVRLLRSSKEPAQPTK
jgi:electron transfer flavoprotein alpha subunit